MENIINNQEQIKETKTYSQEEVDAIVSKSKSRVETKYEKEYVPKNEYESLKNEYETISKRSMDPIIKKSFINNGGKEEAYEDFIRLNGDLYKKDNHDKEINELSKKYSYMFNKEFKADFSDRQEKYKGPKSEEDSDDMFYGNTTIKKWGWTNKK